MGTKLHGCPNCGGRLAHITVYQGGTGLTRAGVVFGDEFIKCENGCKKEDILGRRKKACCKLSDPVFMEMIQYARSIGKKITKQDQAREQQIFNRLRNAR